MASFQGRVQLKMRARLMDEAWLATIRGVSFYFLIGCGALEQPSQPYIIGGHAPSPDSPAAKSTVAIFYSDLLHCSGVYIGNHKILSAAHCFEEEPSPRDLTVAFGDSTSPLEVASYSMHPNYQFPDFDLSLVTLRDVSEMDEARAIPILPSSLQILEGSLLTLAGFGTSDPNEFVAGKLLVVETLAHGLLADPATQRPGLLLYGPTASKGACFGDSGGPAFYTVDSQTWLAGVAIGPNTVSGSSEDCADGEGMYTFLPPLLEFLADSAG